MWLGWSVSCYVRYFTTVSKNDTFSHRRYASVSGKGTCKYVTGGRPCRAEGGHVFPLPRVTAVALRSLSQKRAQPVKALSPG